VAAIKAFREPYLIASLSDADDFEDWEARRVRYALLWSYYENTAYSDVHSFSKSFRARYGLYRYVRGIYNPANRILGFAVDHVWGGALDREADNAGAIPIDTDNSALRPAIAQLWQWSNWQARKDRAVLYGATLGDAAIRVVDDTEKGKVYLDVINPGIIEDVTLDDYGNVKGYVLTEERADPRPNNRGNKVTYQEEATRDGDRVVYQTFLNGTPYPWNGQAAEWEVAYGFVPLVMIQNIDVGLKWGWSELHANRAKFSEIDDVASKLNDQIRKMVEGAWLFTGVTQSTSTPTATSTATSATSSSARDVQLAGREEMVALYGPAGANAVSLIAPLDIASTAGVVRDMLAEIERDYPELKLSVAQASGELSGRALRVARQPLETRIAQRRAVYDDALVRAQQMAIAIAGMRGLPDFAGFNLDSYAAGALDHHIGERPVFQEDPMDGAEAERTFWEAAKMASEAGVPLPAYLELQGWDQDRIDTIVGSEEYQAKQDMVRNMASLGNNLPPAGREAPDDAGTPDGAGETENVLDRSFARR